MRFLIKSIRFIIAFFNDQVKKIDESSHDDTKYQNHTDNSAKTHILLTNLLLRYLFKTIPTTMTIAH